MTQNEKDLLLKDLSARLPYGVKVSDDKGDTTNIVGMYKDSIIIPYAGITRTIRIDDCRPCLFPLSSMTEEQKVEFDKMSELDSEYLIIQIKNDAPNWTSGLNRFNWLLKNHFDVYGIIPMGLALDATDKNIY